MRKIRILIMAVAAAVVSALTVGGIAGTASAHDQGRRPASRVLIVLFDQMLPQYANDFAMPNFRRLRDQGTNYRNAYLGYMASETVISHNVIPSGLLPKHMGYTDEAYRDVGNIFNKTSATYPGPQMHITGDFSLADFATVQKNNGRPYLKLADYLHAARPGTKFITVGEKSYAVETAAANGASNDIAVRLSGRQSNVTGDYATPLSEAPESTAPGGCRNLFLTGDDGQPHGRWRYPYGKNVPSYLKLPDSSDPTLCGRYFINSDKAVSYGTTAAFPSFMYPSEGNRFWPGTDAGHLGGDTWVADAAIEMIKKEPWSGMFVTMGAIDKAGHMWGAQADTAPQDCTTVQGMTHVRCAAENADKQLGKLLAAVKQVDAQKGGHTLVVLTADHGATFGEGANFHGKRTANAGDSNWYYAPANLGVWDAGSAATAPDTATYSDPSPDIAALNADGNVQFSYQSTAIEAWLLDRSPSKLRAKAQTMLGLPGVTATYFRHGDHFDLYGTNPMTSSERSWWKQHGQEIVDTMAAPDGPDVIGLEHDRTSYGVYGDHGGAQESVQRVPMVFWSPGSHGDPTSESFRTIDVAPTILRAMGISPTQPMDGRAHTLGN